MAYNWPSFTLSCPIGVYWNSIGNVAFAVHPTDKEKKTRFFFSFLPRCIAAWRCRLHFWDYFGRRSCRHEETCVCLNPLSMGFLASPALCCDGLLHRICPARSARLIPGIEGIESIWKSPGQNKVLHVLNIRPNAVLDPLIHRSNIEQEPFKKHKWKWICILQLRDFKITQTHWRDEAPSSYNSNITWIWICITYYINLLSW